MNRIHLQQTLPQVLAGCDAIISQIWHQNTVLSKGRRYLAEVTSGTGKSSLYSYIYGCCQGYQGVINFDEQNTHSLSVNERVDIRKHPLSILFQELCILPELIALENVSLKNRLSDYKKKKEIIVLFEVVGISDKINEETGMPSSEQQQRVAFIRSLCQPFDFIFLDESISHLDDENSAIMSQLLMEETEEQGAGVIVMSIGRHLELPYDETFWLQFINYKLQIKK